MYRYDNRGADIGIGIFIGCLLGFLIGFTVGILIHSHEVNTGKIQFRECTPITTTVERDGVTTSETLYTCKN